MDKFPRPYVNSVPKEGEASIMEYTSFPTMGIGARPSGMPKDASEGPKAIDHVGKSAEGGKGKK